MRTSGLEELQRVPSSWKESVQTRDREGCRCPDVRQGDRQRTHTRHTGAVVREKRRFRGKIEIKPAE